MTQKPELDELLDAWEDRSESEADLSATQFIRSLGDQVDSGLIEDFLCKAAELAAFQKKADRLVFVDDSQSTSLSSKLSRNGLELGERRWLTQGAEPIDGYRLVSKLGRGGFGEVWRATGPGGFDVALKFVETGGRVGVSELRSLETMKGVRHPHLLPMFGAWQVDGMLVIATELADRTLLDRFEEARRQGYAGIPLPELLRYMNEAAQGIDALNNPGSSGRMRIQHRDIKPQNILLSGGGVKIGDFGLARFLQHGVTGHTGSMTMAYAAPECFDGTISEHSDQYSLAVTYYHLCCGRLPFDGTPVAVMNGHRTQQPDLSCVPKSQRPVLAKALAKLPKDRWGSCTEFVSQLLETQSLIVPEPASDAGSEISPARPGAIAAACFVIAAILIGGVSALNMARFYLKNEQSALIGDQSRTGVSRPRIAVLYFEDQSTDVEPNQALSKGLCSMITTGLSNLDKYDVVERVRLQAVLDELKITREDSFDRKNVAKIGSLLGTQQLLLGSYFEILGTFRIDARIVDVETGVMIKAAGVEGRPEGFNALVAQLLNKLEQAPGHENDTQATPPVGGGTVPSSAVELLGKATALLDEGEIQAAIKVVDDLLIEHPQFDEASVLRGDLQRFSNNVKASFEQEARDNTND